ncbi:MAG: hypothetical protein WCC00_04280 [Candidatus Aminicenantales bacterium]
MIWKWLGAHLFEVISAVGIVGGVGFSIYKFIVHRKTLGRRLDVKITYGQFRDAPDGLRCMPMLFIDVANIGYMPVTVDEPYFILADDRTYSPPKRVSDVQFPHELNISRRFSLAAREADIREFYGTSCGYKGEVLIYGAVKDQTGKVWKSKKPWRLGLRDGKQTKKGNRLEWKAIGECEGNFREYKGPLDVRIWLS